MTIRAYNQVMEGEMVRECRVLIVEDDFYARNWMELLLRRDWRTKVTGEVNSPAELSSILEEKNGHCERIDLILMDTDIPHDPSWLTEALRSLAKHRPKTAILLTGVAPNIQITRLLAHSNFAGYVLKDEIRYSLAWAVSLAIEGHIVITPGVCDLFEKTNPFPPGTLILDGRNPVAAFSKRDSERARMAFIFSMERHEFADELGISEDYSYGVVSELFDKIGLNDVLLGNVKPEQYFGAYPTVLIHVQEAIEKIRQAEKKAREKANNKGNPTKDEKMAKVKEKESLAFHLLTLPDISQISGSGSNNR